MIEYTFTYENTVNKTRITKTIKASTVGKALDKLVKEGIENKSMYTVNGIIELTVTMNSTTQIKN